MTAGTILGSIGVGAAAKASAPASLLIVGDSLSVQAAPAVPAWLPSGSQVVVEAGIGSAPCDWVTGYHDAWSNRNLSFYRSFDQTRPRAVVFAFSGNGGISGPAAGCVDTRTQYSLEDLLTSYTRALTPMAQYASSNGAAVYFAAAPPRNPATPAGAYHDAHGHSEYGFNGVSQINDLYQSLGLSGLGLGWHYDVSAALGVSQPGLVWTLDMSCQAWDTTNCHHGQVQVRAGGLDAIHLDPWGAGAVRFAQGLMRQPLMAEGYKPRG